MPEAHDTVNILREDEGYLIAAKPPGMETVSAGGEADFTSLIRRSCAESGLLPVHRLDRDTSGAQLFARNPAAEKLLTALFRERKVHKVYLALCLGVPRNRTGTISRNLSEWAGGRRPVRVLKKGGLEASTRYRVLADRRDGGGLPAASLIAFSPKQGRTHQIRVHAAAIGYPILGDDQYGDRPANRLVKRCGIRRQMLHSRRIGFPWHGTEAEAECPLLPDMLAAAECLFGTENLRRALALPED